jgi:hypothetical protein
MAYTAQTIVNMNRTSAAIFVRCRKTNCIFPPNGSTPFFGVALHSFSLGGSKYFQSLGKALRFVSRQMVRKDTQRPKNVGGFLGFMPQENVLEKWLKGLTSTAAVWIPAAFAKSSSAI